MESASSLMEEYAFPNAIALGEGLILKNCAAVCPGL